MSVKSIEKQIEDLIYLSLVGPADMDPKKAYEQVSKTYFDTKYELQQSIARAFERAFHNTAGMSPDYYCDIYVIGEPINKEPI